MSTDSRIVLVPGGTGNVGEGIVRAFLRDGARVAVPSRSRERLDALAASLDEGERARLIPLLGDVGTAEGARALAHAAALEGQVDTVVAAIGGWWQGQPLVEVTPETFVRILNDILVAHFIVARTFLPAMTDDAAATYVFINGFSAEEPYPLAGPVSAAAAAQLMLGRVLMRELEQAPVRVHELVLGPIMSRTRTRGRPDRLSAEEVGAFAVALARARPRVASQVFRLLDRPGLQAASREAGLGVRAE